MPDILAPNLAVVFCGINPATSAATAGQHFASATNRFWLVLYRAGFTPRRISPADGRAILQHGYGLTTAVARPTRKAADLTHQEMRAARGALERKMQRYAPQVVAFLGKAAYAAMTENRTVAWGRQSELFAGAVAWILPNPSGLNRSFRSEDLVQAYRELRNAVAQASSS